MGKNTNTTQGGAPAGAAPLTVEQLQELLNVNKAALSESQSALAASKSDLDVAKEILAAEKANHEETKVENEAAKGIISDLEAKYADKELEVKSKKAVITVDKKQYEVLPGSYSYNGEVVNEKVLKSNPKLAAELIEIGAGFIKKLEA